LSIVRVRTPVPVSSWTPAAVASSAGNFGGE
jgi:hypothetical protein